jgi:four helix bundle protein
MRRASNGRMSNGYRNLKVWITAMDLVDGCYRATASFPREETYGLTSQIRRAACSIPVNVAEGHCRRTTKAYANHVSIALGSHGEVETCLEIAERLGFLSNTRKKEILVNCDSVGRMLNGLYASLERKMLGS